VIILDLLWWTGWVYLAAWVALPLVALPLVGTVVGLILWSLLAPWSALLGMAALHRLLPRSPEGSFHMFSDRGSIAWALKGWAPSLFLTVFQPVFFLSEGFQRIALRAFQARLAPGALLTSRTIVREPHHLRVGASTLIGEYAHLGCSYQPRPKRLVVAGIDIGNRVLIGAYCRLAPGTRVGSGSILEYAVSVGPHSMIGENTRIGAQTSLYNRVRIGSGVTIGKRCLIPSGAVIPDGTRIADGTVVAAETEDEESVVHQ
jgi:acetyltransferase-like isoleucine patch superfamily enzyme